MYLQDENEEVHWFASLVHVVMRRALIVLVELDLVDHVRMAQDSQQDLVGDLSRAEQTHLYGRKERETFQVLVRRQVCDVRCRNHICSSVDSDLLRGECTCTLSLQTRAPPRLGHLQTIIIQSTKQVVSEAFIYLEGSRRAVITNSLCLITMFAHILVQRLFSDKRHKAEPRQVLTRSEREPRLLLFIILVCNNALNVAH